MNKRDRVDFTVGAEYQVAAVASRVDFFDTQSARLLLDRSDPHEVLRGRRQQAEAINHFHLDCSQRIGGVRCCDAFVQYQPGVGIRQIVFGNQRGHIEVDLGARVQRRGGFVQHEDRRLVAKGEGGVELLPVSARQAAERLVEFGLQVELADAGDAGVDQVAGLVIAYEPIWAIGTGKTATASWLIEQVNRPTLVLAHNKTLATQLYSEFREFFPDNAVEYFVSYFDYYQPEAYLPRSDTYIEKDSSRNDEIDKLRHAATRALFERKDVIIVASVSCIYGLGSPEDYRRMTLSLEAGGCVDRDAMLEKLVEAGMKSRWSTLVDSVMERLPLIRSIYNALKKLMHMFEARDHAELRAMESVLCHFGGKGGTAVLALMPSPDRIRLGEQDYYGVLIPTAPVPFGGAILYVPVEWVEPVDIAFDEMFNIYMSMGVTSSDYLQGRPGQGRGAPPHPEGPQAG